MGCELQVIAKELECMGRRYLNVLVFFARGVSVFHDLSWSLAR